MARSGPVFRTVGLFDYRNSAGYPGESALPSKLLWPKSAPHYPAVLSMHRGDGLLLSWQPALFSVKPGVSGEHGRSAWCQRAPRPRSILVARNRRTLLPHLAVAGSSTEPARACIRMRFNHHRRTNLAGSLRGARDRRLQPLLVPLRWTRLRRFARDLVPIVFGLPTPIFAGRRGLFSYCCRNNPAGTTLRHPPKDSRGHVA